ncbi:hypothetical protein VUR80DRAFT_9686 [Thermomyces stellatus]
MPDLEVQVRAGDGQVDPESLPAPEGDIGIVPLDRAPMEMAGENSRPDDAPKSRVEVSAWSLSAPVSHGWTYVVERKPIAGLFEARPSTRLRRQRVRRFYISNGLWLIRAIKIFAWSGRVFGRHVRVIHNGAGKSQSAKNDSQVGRSLSQGDRGNLEPECTIRLSNN